jgi:monovalent cation/hydrogen antiporter
LHKKAEQKQMQTPAVQPDPLLNAKLEISKFQRELLIKLHKEGDFSDAVLKKVEREMDVDELKLNLQLPKDDNAI